MSTIAIVDDSFDNFQLLRDIILSESSRYPHSDFPKNIKFVHFESGEDFFRFEKKEDINLILMDYFLMTETGEQVCHRLKKIEELKSVPVIFVSGAGVVDERLKAFESGASDFVTRPFNSKEFFYRIKVHWTNIISNKKDQMANLIFDRNKNQFLCEGKELDLSQKEFLILKCLFENRQRIIYREEVKKAVWGDQELSNGNMDTQMYNLKKKLQCFRGQIKTLNRIGFRLTLNQESN